MYIFYTMVDGFPCLCLLLQLYLCVLVSVLYYMELVVHVAARLSAHGLVR